MSKKIVFVYGSLKRGFYNEHFLKDAKLIAKDATTQQKYELYPSADYFFPYLFDEIDCEKSRHIKGELYEVDEVFLTKTLDVLEGVDKGLYSRKTCYIDSSSGFEFKAEIYIANESLYDTDMIDFLPESLSEWSVDNELCGIATEQYIKNNKKA